MMQLVDSIVFFGSAFLLVMLLMELLDWSCVLAALDCPARPAAEPFHYSCGKGPSTWRRHHCEARGRRQSPLNVVARDATVLTPCEMLKWQGYCDEPISMSLSNNGNTVELTGFWSCTTRPYIQGGPLSGVYDFLSATFRWGPSDDEGSEHTLDYLRYPMELQLMHVKRGMETPRMCKKFQDSVAVVSYFFQVTNTDNPYLDHVVSNLWRVCKPGSCVHVPAFPLEWLFPTFASKFYTYAGSLTQPPCSEIVTWILQPRLVAISANQLAQFRKVCSLEGPIMSNARPVQRIYDREIFYYS